MNKDSVLSKVVRVMDWRINGRTRWTPTYVTDPLMAAEYEIEAWPVLKRKQRHG
jgi:hypothetical protein